jgi:DNA-binding NtrC family response regulator
MKTAKVLIIEDDEEMGSLLKDFVANEGYKAESVRDGSEALRRLSKEPFDLVITDIRMPGLSGLDILPGVKKLRPEVPVIIITAFGSEEVFRKAISRGANGYFEKPLHLLQLRTLIHHMFSSSQGQEE